MNRIPITIMLIAYNQERFIEDAVVSVLRQDYEPLQIILSDDASTDATYDRIKELGSQYTGSATIVMRRNLNNCGLSQHINEVVGLATGEVILICAGDDIAAPDRATISADYFSRDNTLSALSLAARVINDQGEVVRDHVSTADKLVDRFEYWEGKCPHPHGAARAYHRKVFELFGPLHPECPTEDTPLLLRSMLVGKVLQSGKRGLDYRKHDGSLSTPASISRMNLEDIFSQYESDLESARKMNLVSALEYPKVKAGIETYINRRRPGCDNKSNPSAPASMPSIEEPRTSMRQRLDSLMQYFRFKR